MKRKFFIACAVSLLAIGGAFAVKAQSKFAVVYYQTSTQCLQDPNSILCSVPGTGCTDPSLPGNPQLYQTRFSASECETPLRK